MVKKILKILKHYLSFIIITNINVCRYLSSRLHLEEHNNLFETAPQPMREDLLKAARQFFDFLITSHIEPYDLNMLDLEECEIRFLCESSCLYGLKYLFEEVTYLFFFPRHPRKNKFIGYERVPQDTELVIIRFIKNEIDTIWIKKDKEIISLVHDKLQTKDIQ